MKRIICTFNILFLVTDILNPMFPLHVAWGVPITLLISILSKQMMNREAKKHNSYNKESNERVKKKKLTKIEKNKQKEACERTL
jgi:hypothetical protein